MNKPALLKLAQLLRKPLPKGVDRFDMTNWKETSECGTAACACGLAALDPWFNRRGFRLRGMFDVYTLGNTAVPAYHDIVGFGAVSEFFAITREVAEYLFHSDSYKRGNRLDVARRIEGFVRRGK